MFSVLYLLEYHYPSSERKDGIACGHCWTGGRGPGIFIYIDWYENWSGVSGFNLGSPIYLIMME